MNNNPLRVAINGFGRIGRIFTRIAWEHPGIEVVAINSRSGGDIYAHLLKYDSVYGPWDHEVDFDNDHAIIIDGKKIALHHEDELVNAPWQEHDIDVVIESTGVFRDRDSSEQHRRNGAKYVLITAPAKKEDKTLIFGINHEEFDPENHKIISSASCTTTCLAPVVKVLDESFGIKHGTVITTHSYTNDQHLVDHPHKSQSFRRARAAAMSIVPTGTGAAKAIGKVMPRLDGKLDGTALRVPVAVPSIISFVGEVERSTSVEEVNRAFSESIKKFPGSLNVCNIGLVSADYIRSPYGATLDTLCTKVTNGTQVFVQAWYDNEWGYVTQMTKLLEFIGERIKD